jgi:hypothetical protein
VSTFEALHLLWIAFLLVVGFGLIGLVGVEILRAMVERWRERYSERGR